MPTFDTNHVLEFQSALNKLAGTSGLDAPAAANVWAGTKGLDLIAALNVKNGKNASLPATWNGLNRVCNLLAGTTNLEAQAALSKLAGGK